MGSLRVGRIMELIPHLTEVIFIAATATVGSALSVYAVFELRKRRRPKPGGERPVYFRRVEPPADPKDPAT